MNKTSIAMAIFKPQFKQSFEFKNIDWVQITANKITDALDLIGFGSEDGSIYEERKMKRLKLSEKKDFANLFLKSINYERNENEIKIVVLKMDFKNKSITSTVAYEYHNESGKLIKGKQDFNIKY